MKYLYSFAFYNKRQATDSPLRLITPGKRRVVAGLTKKKKRPGSKSEFAKFLVSVLNVF